MNKRIVLSILLIGVLMFSAGMGTIAYYTQTFTSEGNEIRAAVWDVSESGTLFEQETFEFIPVAPGESEAYDFRINKGDSEVNVEYYITVTGTGDLFDADGCPIVFSAIMNNGSENAVTKGLLSGTTVRFPASVFENKNDDFSLKVKWPWGDGSGTDNSFSSLEGEITVAVEARQVRNSTGDPGEFGASADVDATINFLGVTDILPDAGEEDVNIAMRIYDDYRTLQISGSDYFNATFTVEGSQAATTYTASAQYDSVDSELLAHLTAIDRDDWTIERDNDNQFTISASGQVIGVLNIVVDVDHESGAGDFWFED